MIGLKRLYEICKHNHLRFFFYFFFLGDVNNIETHKNTQSVLNTKINEIRESNFKNRHR